MLAEEVPNKDQISSFKKTIQSLARQLTEKKHQESRIRCTIGEEVPTIGCAHSSRGDLIQIIRKILKYSRLLFEKGSQGIPFQSISPFRVKKQIYRYFPYCRKMFGIRKENLEHGEHSCWKVDILIAGKTIET